VDEMILFKPELIIISAGFDAHDEDPLSSTELIEEDYEWATKIVVQASRKINESQPPPIISSLEGGYNLEHLASSAFAHVQVLATSNDIQVDEDADYGGNEAAALAAHIESLNLNK
jgi:acetoin utilization deacetylase AcuC-like enzyme